MLNPEAILKSYSLYDILDKYARTWERDGVVIEKRNKAWFTGTSSFTDEGVAIEGTDEVHLHILFEAEKSHIWQDEETKEYHVAEGYIVKDRYDIDPKLPIRQQVINSYQDFFEQVMKTFFTNN